MGLMTLGTATMNLAKVVSGFAGEEFPLADTMTGQFGRTVDSKLDNLGVSLENVGDITEELLSITIVPESENILLNAFSEISRGRTIAGLARKLMSFASELRPDINRAPKVIDSQIDNTSEKREKVYEEDSIHVNQ